MKRKTFLLLCLFLSFGLTQLSAQNGKNGTGTEVFLDTYTGDFDYVMPVCNSNGEVIDMLAGPITVRYERHYKNGGFLWEISHFYGEVESVGLDFISGTGELFSIKDQWKTNTPYFGGSGHYHSIGNLGSQYILSYQYDSDWNFIFVKAVSPGNDK